MSDVLFFEKLESKTEDYCHLFLNEPMDQLGMPILLKIRESLPLEIASVVISNYNMPHAKKITYVLRLDRDNIELLELSEKSRNNIMFSFHDENIYLNSKQMSALYKKAFKTRLEQISKDLRANRCGVYEEII